MYTKMMCVLSISVYGINVRHTKINIIIKSFPIFLHWADPVRAPGSSDQDPVHPAVRPGSS